MAFAQRSEATAYLTGTINGLNASGTVAFTLDFANFDDHGDASFTLPNGDLKFYSYWECSEQVPWAVWYGFSIPSAPSIPGLSFFFRDGPDWAENVNGIGGADTLLANEHCPYIYLNSEGNGEPIMVEVCANLLATFDGSIYRAEGTWSYTVDYTILDPIPITTVPDSGYTLAMFAAATAVLAAIGRRHRTTRADN